MTPINKVCLQLEDDKWVRDLSFLSDITLLETWMHSRGNFASRSTIEERGFKIIRMVAKYIDRNSYEYD